MSPANTPLLLITWRRPHTLRQVIDTIRPIPTSGYRTMQATMPARPMCCLPAIIGILHEAQAKRLELG